MELNNTPRSIVQVAIVPLISNTAIDDQIRAAKLLAIDHHYKKRKKSRPGIGSLVLRDLQKIFRDRYDKHGGSMPKGCDEALDDFAVLLNYAAQLGDYRVLRACKARWAPWLSEAAFTAMIADNARTPLYLSADALGERVGLYDAARTRLAITTIGGKDFGKADREDRAKHKNVEDQKARRVKAGATPHSESAAQTKPWLALGMKRTKYYADRAAGTLRTDSLTPAKASMLSTIQSATNQGSGRSRVSGDTYGRSDSHGIMNTELSVSADLALYPAIETVETKRDSTVVGRLCLHWIKNPFESLPLATPESTEMGRAAA